MKAKNSINHAWHPAGRSTLLLLLLLLAVTAAPGDSELVSCSVAEEQPRGTLVCDLAEKTGHQAPVGGSIRVASSQYQLVVRDETARYFELDATRGHLRLASSIDREAIRQCRHNPERPCRLDLAVTFLRDTEDQTSMRLLDVAVTVEDINDNTPTFGDLRGVVQGRIREHDRQGRVQLPRATDPDAGKNGSVVYSFPVDRQSHGDYLKFALEEDKENGRNPLLRVIGDIDLEGDNRVGSRIDLVVLASDEGSPPRSSNLTLSITVENVNDFEPVFEPGAKLYHVKENASVNSVIFTVRATDRDEAPGGISQLSFAIRRTEPPAPFAIDRRNGDVRLRAPLNAEERQHYSFDVEVSDNHRPEPKTAVMTVSVQVDDVNDNAPEIRVSPASPVHGLSVLENQASAMIAIIDVTDKDVDQKNRLLECDLHRFSQQTDAFILLHDSRSDQGAQRFILKNSRPLDRESQSEHRLSLTCSDSSGLLTERPFTVTVRDVNDSPPRFAGSVTRLKFPENQPPYTVIGTVVAHDADEAENADTRYEMSDACSGLLGIGEKNGSVFSKIRFDRELNASLHCSVQAYDAKRPEMNANTNLLIEVEDLNDCRPVFRTENFTFLISENQLLPVVGRVEATDADSGDNGRLTYSLVQPNGAFRVTSSGEILMVAGSGRGLNREQQSNYSLRVRVQDHGRPPLTADTVVTIEVVDENDNAPRFVYPSSRNSSLNVSVHERPGAIVAKITAVDDDSGRNSQLTFDLEPLPASGGCDRELFRLDADSGQLLLAQTVPQGYADRTSCRLTIVASDKGAEPRRTSQSLTIHFTAARPRSMGGGGSRGIHGADSIGTADGGLGGLPGGRRGPRDLVVITVCVALSFLVLLCVVLLMAYFCYYLQSPGLNPGARRAGQEGAAGRRPAVQGGSKSAGTRWLKRLGLNGRGSSLQARGAPSSPLGTPTDLGRSLRGVASNTLTVGGASFISRPVLQLKAGTEAYLEERDEEELAMGSNGQPVRQYFGDSRNLSAAASAGANQPGHMFPSRRGSAFSHAAAAAGATMYVEHGEDGNLIAGDYQTMAVGGEERRLHARRRLNYLSVDSKMPAEAAGAGAGSASYYKSLRPPSTDPTQRRQHPMGSEALAAAAGDVDSSAGRPFHTVQYLVDPPVPGAGATVMTRLENARTAAAGGYVYGSPYLTSSFV